MSRWGGHSCLPFSLSFCRNADGRKACAAFIVGATGRSPLLVVAQSGLCGGFREVADEAQILLFAVHEMYMSRQECLLHPLMLLLKV